MYGLKLQDMTNKEGAAISKSEMGMKIARVFFGFTIQGIMDILCTPSTGNVIT